MVLAGGDSLGFTDSFNVANVGLEPKAEHNLMSGHFQNITLHKNTTVVFRFLFTNFPKSS